MYMYESHHIFVPPDGGCYWMVILSAFYANFVVDGILLSYGIFLEEFRNHFKVRTGLLITVPTVNYGLLYLVVPFVTAMLNKYGFRCATLIGGIISGICFLAIALVQDFPFLLIINGFCAGMALCMVYAPTKITTGFYFARWRSVASMIVESGSGFGIMLMPQILSNIQLRHGWLTAYVSTSGFLFLSAIFSIFYRPVRATRILVEEEATPEHDRSNGVTKIKCSKFCWDTNINNKNIPTTTQVVDRNKIMLDTQESSQISIEIKNFDTLTTNTTTITTTTGTDSPTKFSKTKRKVIDPEEKCCGITYRKRKILFKNLERIITCYYCKRTSLTRPIYRDDIFYNQDLMLLEEYRQHQDINISLPDTSGDAYKRVDYHMSITRIAEPTPDPEDEENHYVHQCCWSLPIARTVITMLDCRILKTPAVFVFSLSCSFVAASFLIPFLFIVDRAIFNDFTRTEAIWLLSTVGLSYILGRMICALVPPYTKFSSLSYCFVNIMVSGIFTLISGMNGLVDSKLQFPYALIYGFTSSSFSALRPKIIVDLFGLLNLTNIYGLQTLFMGLGIVLGLTSAGMILDKTGSYMIVFLFSGCGLITSGLLLVLSQYLNNFSSKPSP